MQIQYLPSGRKYETGESTNIYTKEESPILGIDFGTTNSVLANYIYAPHFMGAKVAIFSQTGDKLYPSVALYNKIPNRFITGFLAFKKRLLEPTRVISSVKRLLLEEKIILDNTALKPQEIVEEILCGILSSVRDENPQAKPSIITLTVPYYFMQLQNLILRDAAAGACRKIFGKNCRLEILPEPVASALYWIYKNKGTQGLQTFLIFDIGGGTFDLSVVKSVISHNRISCEIIATGGCEKLGGDDIDGLIFQHIIQEHNIHYKQLDEKSRHRFIATLMDAVVNAKCELAYQTDCEIVIPNPEKTGEHYIEYVLTREMLERLLYSSNYHCESFIGKISRQVEELLSRPSLKNIVFDNIILIGGPTKMPIIREYIQDTFPNTNIQIQDDLDDNHLSVAKGAAIYSALMDSGLTSPFGENIKEVYFTTCIPHSIYIERFDGSLELIIPQGTKCPAVEQKVFFPTKATDDKKGVELSEIKVFQTGPEAVPIHIGTVNLVGEYIYTHGRLLEQILITVKISAEASLIHVEVFVPNGNSDSSDYQINEYIKI